MLQSDQDVGQWAEELGLCIGPDRRPECPILIQMSVRIDRHRAHLRRQPRQRTLYQCLVAESLQALVAAAEAGPAATGQRQARRFPAFDGPGGDHYYPPM